MRDSILELVPRARDRHRQRRRGGRRHRRPRDHRLRRETPDQDRQKFRRTVHAHHQRRPALGSGQIRLRHRQRQRQAGMFGLFELEERRLSGADDLDLRVNATDDADDNDISMAILVNKFWVLRRKKTYRNTHTNIHDTLDTRTTDRD